LISHIDGDYTLRFFENRVLRKIFSPKKYEVTIGEWRRLYTEKLYDRYSFPNITHMIKSRRMKLAGQIARMGD
jgi:hypothetical protein